MNPNNAYVSLNTTCPQCGLSIFPNTLHSCVNVGKIPGNTDKAIAIAQMLRKRGCLTIMDIDDFVAVVCEIKGLM